MPSELSRQTYASPLSFVGSARRIIRRGSALSRAIRGKDQPAVLALLRLIPAALWWVVVAVAVAAAWVWVAVWYCVIFGLFGVFVIPFRLFRRGQRKDQAIRLAQLAELERAADRTQM